MQEFGFPELRAKKALLASGMSVEAAITWLEAHQEDMDIDEPIALVPQVVPYSSYNGAVSTLPTGSLVIALPVSAPALPLPSLEMHDASPLPGLISPWRVRCLAGPVCAARRPPAQEEADGRGAQGPHRRPTPREGRGREGRRGGTREGQTTCFGINILTHSNGQKRETYVYATPAEEHRVRLACLGRYGPASLKHVRCRRPAEPP